MKILGIVAEYNPFHNGHKYHLEQSKKITGADYSIAIMSGSFLQRGEPALIDKFSRSKSAILGGIDLVIELPFIYSSQTAEVFSKGAIKILDSLNVVDFVSFGSEMENLDDLKLIAKTLLEEPKDFSNFLQEYLKSGLSFARARELALNQYFTINQGLNLSIETILKGSNNILSIEYLKELYFLNSSIEPISIKRLGNNYRDDFLGQEFSSASSIRKYLLEDKLDDIVDFLPTQSLKTILDFKASYKNYNTLENYYSPIVSNLILNPDSLNEIFDITFDLKNVMVNNLEGKETIQSLVDSMSSKSYTRTRIQRACINSLLSYTKDFHKEIRNEKISI